MGHVGTTQVGNTACGSQKFLGTGEHGVGIGKKGYLVDELGEGTVKLMQIIKQTVDPLNLLNPGKVRL
jgi:FAD/FMN-containing dehydrogenase